MRPFIRRTLPLQCEGKTASIKVMRPTRITTIRIFDKDGVEILNVPIASVGGLDEDLLYLRPEETITVFSNIKDIAHGHVTTRDDE